MKKFLIILSLILTANCSIASQYSATLDKIENSVFGFTYMDDDENRLTRLEQSVYGESKAGTIDKRISNLSKDMSADSIGKEITPKEDTFADDEIYSPSDKFADYTPPAAANVDYPSINELERELFKQEYKNKDLNERLSSLEQKALGKSYDNDALSTRVERLQAKVKPKSFMDNSIAQSSNDYYDRSVGEIPLNNGVSSSGARTYNIPVPTAAGFKFVPEVTLSYSSQASEGWVGYGWDIQGVSAITLINKNKYYHEVAKGASVFDSDPVFSLDGVPLVRNIQPETMNDFPLITANGNILASPVINTYGFVSAFNVAYPNGSRAVFGFGQSIGYNMPSYPITQITDIEGNKITYSYYVDQTNANNRLTAIRYGYTSSTSYQCEILFSYSSLSGHVSHYYAGRSIFRAYRLDSIVSKNGTEEICRLLLSYQQDDNTQLLNKVECVSDGDTLRPLLFSYGMDSPDYRPPEYYLSRENGLWMVLDYDQSSNYIYRRGKFARRSANDGILMYRAYSNYGAIGYHYYWLKKYYDFGSPYPSSAKILYAPSLVDFTTFYEIPAEGGFQTAEAVDIDGDGLDEIVKVNLGSISGSSSTLAISIYKSANGAAPVFVSSSSYQVDGVVTSGGQPSPCRFEYFWGDFLGNGKVQLLTATYDKNYNTSGQVYSQNSHVALIDISGGVKLCDTQLFTFPENGPKRLIACDLDNDSQTELCYASSDGLAVYRFTSGSFVREKTLGNITDATLASDSNPYYITDLNGDGYIDIMRAPDAGSNGSWGRYSFNGEYFYSGTVNLGNREEDDVFMFIDLNRDGLADIVKINGTSLGTYMNRNGNSFNTYQVQAVTVSDARGIVPASVMTPGMVNSFIKIDDGYAYPYTYAHQAPERRLLLKSVDCIGRLLVNTYSYLPHYSSYWSDSSATVDNEDGYMFRTLPLYVLSGENGYTREDYPRIKTKDMSYWYYDGVVHQFGLGFCGFSKIWAFDYRELPVRGSTTSFDPQKRGVVTTRTNHFGINGSPYLTLTNTYDSHTTTYGKLNPRLTKSVAVDSLSGVTTTTNYTYGYYDLPTAISVSQSSVTGSTQTQARYLTYQNSLSPSKYLIGLLTQETITTETDGDLLTSWRQREVHAYDDTGRPVSTNRYTGPFFVVNNLISTTRRTYDSHGNVTSEKTAPYGATEFIGDTLVYDSNGRYLLSKADALGRTTTYSGYNKFGKPTSVTDYHSHTTTYTYDSWGNLIGKSYADGGTEQTTSAWGGDGLYTVTQTSTGSPETVIHYDALGREVKSGVKRFDGQWQWTNKEYDSRGRLSRVSLPYRGSSPAYWNTYYYDIYDRPDSLVEASGRVTRWAYSGTSTTTVKDGVTTTVTTDALGRTVSVSDAGGTVTYNLRDDGQPSSVVAPGNIVTSFTYDDYGRRTQMVDPSLGTETDSFVWNADGSSSTTHTNRNGTITTSKDKYGRVTSVSRAGEFNTTYSYDTYGRLSSVSSTNSTGKQYTYDAYDRIATLKETVPDGKWLQKTYSYSTGSVLSSIAYTSQSGYITTENYTYANGHNTGITVPSSVGGGQLTVWSLVSENDLGQPTEITTGGFNRQYGFTAFGLPTYRKMDDGYIQNYSYQFDPLTGNLLSRTDEFFHRTESFTYDNLNRLTGITQGGVTRQIVYSDNGNINSIGGVGTLIYGGGEGVSPYEVTGLTPEAGQPAYRQRSVTYNSFDRPSYVVENTFDYPEATYVYNADGEKVFAHVSHVDGELHWQYYIGGRYEYDNPYGTATERLYLGGDAYSAPMVMQRTGSGSWGIYNIGRDYLGSITDITDYGGAGYMAHYRYDPWGRMVDPYTGQAYTLGSEPSLLLGRGFTSHEYLPMFGLINANARLYDPLLGRFLSPDPYVQDPDNTQNFNRYSYCLNNPLRYTDEDGEMWTGLTAMIMFPITLYKGIVKPIEQTISGNWDRAKNSFSKAWSEYGKKVANSAKIDWGLVETDKSQSLVERYLTVLSRFSWELPQTFLGNTLSHVRNIFGDVSVEYYRGATLVNSNSSTIAGGGMTLGSYIHGINLVADPLVNPTFAHEYGHTIQSRILGPLYIPLVAPPSFIGSAVEGSEYHNHRNEWYEVWANNLSVNYFKSIERYDVADNMKYYFPVEFVPDDFFFKTLFYYMALAFLIL